MFYIEIIVFSLLAVNFFYRVISLFIKIRRRAYSEGIKYSFRCSSCKQTYTLSGLEAKKLVKGAIRIQKSTPQNQSTFYQFTCPICHKYSTQEKLFDLNTTKALGALRIQMDSYQIPMVIDFLLKGVLPIVLIFPFLTFLLSR